MSFSEALVQLKNGLYLQRAGWNGKGMYVFLHFPPSVEAISKYEPSTLPYIIMKTACGAYVPWLASQTDILADDWETYPF